MSRAHVRVYGDLADFLAPERRQVDIAIDFDVAPTVKDALEGLGVPHTEVELLLVDGEPVGFDERLADGDRVAVYPAFADLDVSPLATLQPPPLAEPRFVVDGHLGTLARRLRLLGFDTDYAPQRDDDELAAISAAADRILLTRDRGLLKRRIVRRGLFVRDDDPEEQALDVVRRLGIADRVRPFTRCTTCNGELVDVDKSTVADDLPAATVAEVDEFRRCRECGQVYWRGAHHRRLRRFVDRLSRK